MADSAITTFDTSITTRGFTGHEQIDAVGLVHMNGRVYESTLGRFLSADPIVEAIDNLQTYNRYSYVRNNPVTLTDPSGFTADSDSDAGDGWGDANIDAALGWSSTSDAYNNNALGKALVSDDNNRSNTTTTDQKVKNTLGHKAAQKANEANFAAIDVNAQTGLIDPSKKPGVDEGVEVAALPLAPLAYWGGMTVLGILGIVTAHEVGQELQKAVDQDNSYNRDQQVNSEKAEEKTKTKDGAKTAASGAPGQDPDEKNKQPNKADENKAEHILGEKNVAKHKLESYLKSHNGNKVDAYNALRQATQRLADQGKITGQFQTNVTVNNFNITVRGNVISNQARIGTAFIP